MINERSLRIGLARTCPSSACIASQSGYQSTRALSEAEAARDAPANYVNAERGESAWRRVVKLACNQSVALLSGWLLLFNCLSENT